MFLSQEHCNGLHTTTKGEAPLGKYQNGNEAKRYFPNSYASIIGMVLYLVSKTRPDTSFTIHKCSWFTHTTKSSHEIDVKITCMYLQGTKYKFLVFNTSNKMMVNCYVDAYYVVLWVHDNPQDLSMIIVGLYLR